MTNPKIAFIGLGAMGAPMAGRLLAAGYSVTSCANRNRAPIEALTASGIIEASSSTDAISDADIIMLVVWDEAQIDAILRDEKGALHAMKPGSCVLIMSTVAPDYCRALGNEAAKLGIRVFDCPLAGMPAGAEAGTLSLMVGGETGEDEPLLEALAVLGTVYRCGPLGAGQAVKLGNNAMFIGTMGLLLELREMMGVQGVEWDTFLEVLNNSTGRSFVSQNIPLPPSKTLPLAMPQKDVSRCVEAGGGIAMPVVESVLRNTLEYKD